jgi:hypothetical protein
LRARAESGLIAIALEFGMLMQMEDEMNPSALKPLDRKDVRWLKSIDKQIWSPQFEIHGEKDRWPKRKLTGREKNRVFSMIRDNELPCELFAAVYGTVTLLVYDHPTEPGVKPKRLASIHEHSLPRKADGWEAFSPITHSTKNRALVRRYGLSRPKERSHYEY